ncbi:MAG: DUF2764 family protein [Bacteroidales bacterium]|nr:DUF2764 family protein [Bacteroidales bacterium]MDZ4204347.1 DUF2764 family protein [Bacteroidales bacterium]
MINRNYYYLVAGLPDIIIEQSKITLALTDFKAELNEHLHPDDYKLVELLFLPADNRNVLNMLMKNIGDFDTSGRYTFDDIEDGIKEPEIFPHYLATFINHFKDNNPIVPNSSWENQMTTLYFDYIHKFDNAFLREWFLFELNVKNVLTALNSRRHKLTYENQLISNNIVVECIRKSNARDFGLANEFPLVEKLLQINENSNLLEREKALDLLRWHHLDDLNTFNYFTIEMILGYVIKLGIVERWMKLDKKTGEQMFRQFLMDLEKSYEFPKEFNA